MSISLSGGELLNIAIGIEKRGIIFYDIMLNSTENEIARDVFQYLLDTEQQHIQIFNGMLGELDEAPPPPSLTGEYTAYFQALIDSAVFTDDMITSEMATQVDTDVEAIELAIGAEKDSILFYYEMKEVMPERFQPMVVKIISEEKSHLQQLSELKRKLAAL